MEIRHEADLCVVGGGLAGLCAAVSAARHGIRVVLMQERPVLGGNASSEIRMWVCGAHGPNNRETGLIEEMELENYYRNPAASFSLWDSVLYEKARFEPNIRLILNCSCLRARMEDGRIRSVTGWQLTTQTLHTVEAALFADCSGDSVLAPLTGAAFRVGREAAGEFHESIEPETADRKTMGMSCLFQIRETPKPQPFIPPAWAYSYPTDADLPFREHGLSSNFWWIELGGEQDSIRDTEEIRDELLKIALGVWDHIKNRGDHGADNWVIDWLGFLPGKRESRRYIGAYTMTQNDVEAGGRFEDVVAYGGWTMDDHHPAGFAYKDAYPTIFHPAPSPYGIPYRCLYARDVPNLFFAGRNISVTHAVLSSTRVMATCALMGQAVGTAAAIAVRRGLLPDGVARDEMRALQSQLMEDDCYLPGLSREIPALTKAARLEAPGTGAENLRSGIDRPVGGADNGWWGRPGDAAVYDFGKAVPIRSLRLVFDSDLNRSVHNMPCCYPLELEGFHVPATLVRSFRLEALDESGAWREIFRTDDCHQRLVRITAAITARAVRFTPLATWGAPRVHVFAFDVR